MAEILDVKSVHVTNFGVDQRQQFFGQQEQNTALWSRRTRRSGRE